MIYTALVVEDEDILRDENEDILRDIAVQALENGGFTVLEAEHAA